jgi:hypothetical protein
MKTLSKILQRRDEGKVYNAAVSKKRELAPIKLASSAEV